MADDELIPASMPIHEAQSQRKRPRDEECPDEGWARSTQRQNASVHPHDFGKTPSLPRLTSTALRELDRRAECAPPRLIAAPESPSRQILRPESRSLRQLAAAGGPDLSVLRGIRPYASPPTAASSMSPSSSLSRTSDSWPYDGPFEQMMMNIGIHSLRYLTPDGHQPEPANLEHIGEVLRRPRRSLSPSVFPKQSFDQFRVRNMQVTSEADAVLNLIPVITGAEDPQCRPNGGAFNNMEKFDPSITMQVPDAYYGTDPSHIQKKVREDLSRYIVPSTNTSLPAAPNFFRADKGPTGKLDVAERQCMYDGAVGARAMWHLQNYGNPTPIYDGKAYTITSTYHPRSGTLRMLATHPGPPTSDEGKPQYYITQLRNFAMTDTLATFRDGATAYRNGREFAKEQRDRLISHANEVAQRRSQATQSFSTGRDIRASSTNAEVEELSGSETSTDELALDHVASAKRRRKTSR